MGELLNRSRELNEARRADEDRGVRVSLPRDLIDALINSSAVITTRAVHPRGTDALLQVFLDVVTTRRRLTPTDSMRLVWIAGPSMPAGGAT